MNSLRWSAAVAVIVAAACVAYAERPTEEKKEADVVVTGTLTAIREKDERIGPKKDGVLAQYEADLNVAAVQKGAGIKPGDVLKITWIHITKRPSGGFVGAFGHAYRVRAGDRVQAYLMKRDDGVLEVIYNPSGLEKK